MYHGRSAFTGREENGQGTCTGPASEGLGQWATGLGLRVRCLSGEFETVSGAGKNSQPTGARRPARASLGSCA